MGKQSEEKTLISSWKTKHQLLYAKKKKMWMKAIYNIHK